MYTVQWSFRFGTHYWNSREQQLFPAILPHVRPRARLQSGGLTREFVGNPEGPLYSGTPYPGPTISNTRGAGRGLVLFGSRVISRNKHGNNFCRNYEWQVSEFGIKVLAELVAKLFFIVKPKWDNFLIACRAKTLYKNYTVGRDLSYKNNQVSTEIEIESGNQQNIRYVVLLAKYNSGY